MILLVVGCKDKPRPHEAQTTPSGSSTGAGTLTGWERIEALATPAVSAGSSKELEHAMQIARDNQDAWRELRFKYPPTPLADYPQGADALEALHTWANEQGGLPAAPKPTEIGVMGLQIHTLGDVAIDAAAEEEAASIVDGLYLGNRLVAEGRNFLEVQMGVTLIANARRKRAMLAGEAGGSGEPLDSAALDLVRILAAEALQSRRTMDYAVTPEGRKDFIDRAKELSPETSALVKDVTGRTPLGMIPTDEEAAGLRQFWLAALEGAQRGEPAATTIARVKKAAETAGEPAKATAAAIASMLEMLKSSFDRLSEPH